MTAGGVRAARAWPPTPGRPFGIYVHVPFCATRCGYCDFNTYTPGRAGRRRTPTAGWRRCAPNSAWPPPAGSPPGGATPCSSAAARRRCWAAPGLAAVLDAVREHFTLAPGAEVTTEANPESTSPELFAQLRAAGFTRISLGMQSVAPHVLAVLDRVHSPGRALDAARGGPRPRASTTSTSTSSTARRGRPTTTCAARSTPRSTPASTTSRPTRWSSRTAPRWRAGCGAARSRAPDNDVLAQRYELLDARLSAAGFDWYEVSNWSRPGGECRHNLGYWDGGEWWGAGPGAHGYVGGDPMVECQAPQRLCAIAGRRAAAGGRLRAARRRDAAHRGRDAAAAAARRAAAGRARAKPNARRAETAMADGLVTLRRRPPGAHRPGRLLADAVVRTCSTSNSAEQVA